MNIVSSILLVCLAIFSRSSPIAGDDSGNKRLCVKMIKHQPCTTKSTRSERIRFPSSAQAPMASDPTCEGCYSISGLVQVFQSIYGPVQIFTRVKTGTTSPPEKCNGADSNNCGGVGSCRYCDVCESVSKYQSKTSMWVRLERDNKRLDCVNGVKAGNYTNLRVSFRTCTVDEFCKTEGISREDWNSNKKFGQLVFMTIYIFNKSINGLSAPELDKIAKDDGEQVIGCHRMVVKLYECE